jgi:hypothetical protein
VCAIEPTCETVRSWSVKFSLGIALRIRSAALALRRQVAPRRCGPPSTVRSNGCGVRRAADRRGAVLDALV